MAQAEPRNAFAVLMARSRQGSGTADAKQVKGGARTAKTHSSPKSQHTAPKLPSPPSSRQASSQHTQSPQEALYQDSEAPDQPPAKRQCVSVADEDESGTGRSAGTAEQLAPPAQQEQCLPAQVAPAQERPTLPLAPIFSKQKWPANAGVRKQVAKLRMHKSACSPWQGQGQ